MYEGDADTCHGRHNEMIPLTQASDYRKAFMVICSFNLILDISKL